MGFSIPVDGKSVRIRGRMPLLPLRDAVLFPGTSLPLFIGRRSSIAAIERSQARQKLLFAVTQRRSEVSAPRAPDLYGVGVIVSLRQVLRLPDGTMRILVEGMARARSSGVVSDGDLLETELLREPREPRESGGRRSCAVLLASVQAAFLEYARLQRRIPKETVVAHPGWNDPVQASYLMASFLQVSVATRQQILEIPTGHRRLQVLAEVLAAEAEAAGLERRIVQGARAVARPPEAAFDPEAEAGRRKQAEREPEDAATELAELEQAIQRARLPRPVEEKAHRELDRLAKMAPLSPEATVSRTYLDWLLVLPWRKRTRDRTVLSEAEAILNEDHYGLLPVKERILEHIAVLRLRRAVKGPVLCLMGPPGVGKTSLGRSIARALNRRFVRMSLGGVRDEAEIRGHRRTYIGAMPGRILQAMRRAGAINPVILLDEVDKLGMDYRGDPAAALLEVLDPEQNLAFNDHYLEVDYDLSQVLFLTTANTTSGIPPALRDRMEVIRLPGYLENEKQVIAERYLLPKQRAAAGLEAGDVALSKEAIHRIIRGYTREAGVRSLEREIARLCRKVARRKASNELASSLLLGTDGLESYLGIPRFVENTVETRNRTGLATGLAWSEVGGTILQIEVGVLPGRGKLLLTGTLGATMRESAQAALSCVRARAARLGLPIDFYRSVDIHVHIPEGEVPKDGPSAGTAIALAMVSALTRRPTRRSVALTGELTLRGQVLPIGGLPEKAVAAQRAGVRTILLPVGNLPNLAEVPEEVRQAVCFVGVSSLDEVLWRGLARRRKTGSLAADARPAGIGTGPGSGADFAAEPARDPEPGVQPLRAA